MIRPRFEAATIAIDADDHETAEDIARNTEVVRDSEWSLEPFDRDAYTHFPVVSSSEKELLEGGASLASEKRKLAKFTREHVRFLVLVADLYTGEGFVPEQDWLPAEDELLLTDIGGDWLRGLEARIYGRSSPPDNGPSNVIPFRRRPRPPNDGGGGTAA